MAPSRAASDSAHFKNQISKPLKIPDDSTRPETALSDIHCLQGFIVAATVTDIQHLCENPLRTTLPG